MILLGVCTSNLLLTMTNWTNYGQIIWIGKTWFYGAGLLQTF